MAGGPQQRSSFGSPSAGAGIALWLLGLEDWQLLDLSQTEKDWGRSLVGTPGRFASFAHFAAGDLFVALLALVSIAVAWRRLRPSYALFATLAFLMPLASGSLLGMGRFCLVIFPLYVVLAMAGENAAFNRYWLILSSALAVLCMALFSQWHFVG